MVAVTDIMLFVGKRALLSGAFRHILFPSPVMLQILPFSVSKVGGFTLTTEKPGGKMILIPPVLTEFEVMVKVTNLEFPEQIAEGLTTKLTWEYDSATNDKLAIKKVIARTTDFGKETVIKRFVWGEREKDAAGAGPSFIEVLLLIIEWMIGLRAGHLLLVETSCKVSTLYGL